MSSGPEDESPTGVGEPQGANALTLPPKKTPEPRSDPTARADEAPSRRGRHNAKLMAAGAAAVGLVGIAVALLLSSGDNRANQSGANPSRATSTPTETASQDSTPSPTSTLASTSTPSAATPTPTAKANAKTTEDAPTRRAFRQLRELLPSSRGCSPYNLPVPARSFQATLLCARDHNEELVTYSIATRPSDVDRALESDLKPLRDVQYTKVNSCTDVESYSDDLYVGRWSRGRYACTRDNELYWTDERNRVYGDVAVPRGSMKSIYRAWLRDRELG